MAGRSPTRLRLHVETSSRLLWPPRQWWSHSFECRLFQSCLPTCSLPKSEPHIPALLLLFLCIFLTCRTFAILALFNRFLNYMFAELCGSKAVTNSHNGDANRDEKR